MRYILKLSEEQAEIIKIALEEYFRLRMNQTFDFADSICFEGFDSKNFTSEEFDKCIRDRDLLKEELNKLLNKIHPLQFIGGKFRNQTIEMKRAQDIWQVIRHTLWIDRHGDKDDWCVDSREPMPMTDEPLPKMERVKE
jgi:hypothetical protein